MIFGNLKNVALGVLAPSSLFLAAPAWPGGCQPPDPGGSGGASALCGNGRIDVGETCDGANMGTITCESMKRRGGPARCNAYCQFDSSSCDPPVCGNGFIEGFGEQCDGADLGGATCLDPGDGGRFPVTYLGGTLGCSDCSFDTSRCVASVCGDGKIEGAEACDGNVFRPEADNCDDFSFYYLTRYRSGPVRCSEYCETQLNECKPPPGCYPTLRLVNGQWVTVQVCYD
jgi:hypothetical protein